MSFLPDACRDYCFEDSRLVVSSPAKFLEYQFYLRYSIHIHLIILY